MPNMSESDSDLDYESADENADIDVHTKNNNTRLENRETETTNGDTNMSVESSENKKDIANTIKQETSIDSFKEEVVNLNNLRIDTDHDTESNVKETVRSESVDKGCTFSERTKQLEEPPSENTITDDSSKLICKHQFEVDDNRCHQEKQRVPLRLEKKIQQKSQMLKENSVEKGSSMLSENLPKTSETKSSWGFGSWGTNFLSTAASSVSTFTNQVSQGIGTVLETVESTLGAPPPEELAVTLSKRKESEELNESPVDKDTEVDNIEREEKDENVPEVASGILPNVSSWTKVLENTGSRVLMGGLDTLELIGKKTFDIITEGDPGLRIKRAAFAEGITLSQILREAKAEADESRQLEDTEGVEAVHYSQMFDEYQGLVHLEALEMLSKQSQAKIQRLLMRVERNAEVRKTMEEIKSICENIPPLDDPTDCEDFEDFETVCKKYVLELNLAFNVENIIKAQKRITDVVKNYESATPTTSTPEEIYHSAICGLAEFTAKSMETFHKLAELILVQSALEPSVEHFATNLTGLTTVMCIEINNLASRYHHCLDSFAEQSEKVNITSTVTNLYLEASNSNKYIQDAFLLLVPVLQVTLLESSQ